ncbi:MAG: D-glycero-beta-D-manno-heptose 1-phosphate adenylyltransferase [Kiritimatiellae bacterium]|nr:D-glycero-beta-D-manno-heptose 1-phosphate adenylyltransferase [Kiritimatiellia bacterium]NKB24458.1 D-glycero-beta-D-manno-heptose 1-phosphate adenylyltransferase [Kiritimatiellia bacterium]
MEKKSDSPFFSPDAMQEERENLRAQNKTVVFTNGCFDILHVGHVSYLSFAKQQGDILIVGLNSDQSIKRIKGVYRPVVSEKDRASVLLALESVDYVIIFNEEEPASLIELLLPDVLVKGEDWAHYVSGRGVVEANGGCVVLAPMVKGHSSSDIIERIQKYYGAGPR